LAPRARVGDAVDGKGGCIALPGPRGTAGRLQIDKQAPCRTGPPVEGPGTLTNGRRCPAPGAQPAVSNSSPRAAATFKVAGPNLITVFTHSQHSTYLFQIGTVKRSTHHGADPAVQPGYAQRPQGALLDRLALRVLALACVPAAGASPRRVPRAAPQVAIALEELGLPYEAHTVNIMTGARGRRELIRDPRQRPLDAGRTAAPLLHPAPAPPRGAVVRSLAYQQPRSPPPPQPQTDWRRLHPQPQTDRRQASRGRPNSSRSAPTAASPPSSTPTARVRRARAACVCACVRACVIVCLFVCLFVALTGSECAL
jgi:hypothetical protein